MFLSWRRDASTVFALDFHELMETYVLDNIPFEDRRVIDKLVEFWHTHNEPGDLAMHIARLSGARESGIGYSFFKQVYADLRTGRHSKYVAFSVSEFKRLLEVEYSRLAKRHADLLAGAKAFDEAQAKAKEHEENQRWLSAYPNNQFLCMLQVLSRHIHLLCFLSRKLVLPTHSHNEACLMTGLSCQFARR
jgi:hypothetical protein